MNRTIDSKLPQVLTTVKTDKIIKTKEFMLQSNSDVNVTNVNLRDVL